MQWPSRAAAPTFGPSKTRLSPYDIQNMMIQGTGQEWITKDIETGHSPQLAAPERLSAIIMELAEHFQRI